MPTKFLGALDQRRRQLKKQLEALGYKVDLQYAEDDIPTQVQQLDNQITKGAKLLIIASIDGTAITTQLESAKASNIPVIAYDRLIRNSPERGLLRHVRQLQGRCAAGHLAAGRAQAAQGGRLRRAPPRARSTSSCSPARRTTTTRRSSSTAR